MASTQQTFWGFLYWIKHNRHKSIEAMTEDDLDAMVQAFATVNTTASSITTTDPESYGTLEYPQKGGLSDQNGIQAAATQLACDKSHYPDTHYSGD